jgi:iron complex transport system permease protein
VSVLEAATPRLARPAAVGDRSRNGRRTVLMLGVLLVVALCASLLTGAAETDVIGGLLAGLGLTDGGPTELRDRIIVTEIRLPRALLGALVGGGLAVSGAVLQGLFRNPLADPGLVGVSSGAGLAAVVFIVLGGTVFGGLTGGFGIYGLPVAAFAGGLVTTAILYRIATRHGQTAIATLLLAGIALGALAGAATGLLVYLANDAQLRDLTFWGLGSLAGADWAKVIAAGPVILAALALTPFLGAGLNAMTLGEASAHHLGVPVQRFKAVAIVTVAAATGASVAVSGGIGFVGIVVPHVLRMMIGPDHRYLLVASALLGATFLLAADAVSRTIVAPSELPIGIVTAAVGGPFFLFILLRRRGLTAW